MLRAASADPSADPSGAPADSSVLVPPGVRRLRLGELDAGPVATAGPGGGVDLPDGTRVSWWVGAEDRWHRPADEPSTRDRVLDGAPVVESLVRIPSGDAVGRISVGRVDGDDRPSVLIDVENSSPIPVAFAYVVESTEALTLDGGGVGLAGGGRLRLTRPALGFAAAADADALLAVLEAGGQTSEPPAWDRRGAVAILVPLPHTAHAVAAFTPAAGDPDGHAAPPTAGLLDRAGVPAPERIAAGWAVHTASTPRLDLTDGRATDTLAAATADVLLGLGPDASDATAAASLGRLVEALGRLGRVDDPAWCNDLFELQRANGSFPGADPVAATTQAVRCAGAWWSGGAPTAYAELLLGPVADAARWLGKRRRRRDIEGREAEVAAALRLAAGLLDDLDQPEVAAALSTLAIELVDAVDRPALPVGVAGAMLTSLADGLSWGDPSGAPSPVESARFVIASIDDAVREQPDGLEFLPAWSAVDIGRPLEAHDVPTRWGTVSFGVRWHAERPALLWELTPWPGRGNRRPAQLSAPALDPSWTTDQPVGEALLRAPEPIASSLEPDAPSEAPASASAPPTAPDGGTFS